VTGWEIFIEWKSTKDNNSTIAMFNLILVKRISLFNWYKQTLKNLNISYA